MYGLLGVRTYTIWGEAGGGGVIIPQDSIPLEKFTLTYSCILCDIMTAKEQKNLEFNKFRGRYHHTRLKFITDVDVKYYDITRNV